MGRDDQHGAPDTDDPDDDAQAESHAADEPTAVWDESALRAAGLGDLWRKREPEQASKPATPAAAGAAAATPSIVIEETLAGPAAAPLATAASATAAVNAPAVKGPATPVAPAPSKGLGWGATIAIAIALGAVAYALIRFLR